MIKAALEIERKRMNNRISNFSSANPAFVSLYQSSRKVIKTGAGTAKKDQPTKLKNNEADKTIIT
jgi:hypothetical protein